MELNLKEFYINGKCKCPPYLSVWKSIYQIENKKIFIVQYKEDYYSSGLLYFNNKKEAVEKAKKIYNEEKDHHSGCDKIIIWDKETQWSM